MEKWETSLKTEKFLISYFLELNIVVQFAISDKLFDMVIIKVPLCLVGHAIIFVLASWN